MNHSDEGSGKEVTAVCAVNDDVLMCLGTMQSTAGCSTASASFAGSGHDKSNFVIRRAHV